MRGPHRHQYDPAARLLIQLNTAHPWSLRFGLLERPRHPSQLSKKVEIEAWNFRLLKPRRLRIPHKTSINSSSHNDVFELFSNAELSIH